MTYTEREVNIIVTDAAPELNYKQKKLLLASVNEKNPDRQKYADELIKITGEGVYNKLKAQLTDADHRKKILAGLEKAGVSCKTIKSEGYPELLKNIPVPPLVLYMRGNASLLEDDLFAVVGSRKTTAQAAKQCKGVAADLCSRFTIVTGVADGADSAAVSGALPSGRVICVLPCGHGGQCSASPALLREVESSGLTVSELCPGTPAQKYTFLIRNRIIAGLCRGVLVASAAEKSGALNTASYAADYGRDVFAFPYSVGIESGKGCNALIKNGAMLCESAADIFTAYGIESNKQAPELTEEEQKLVRLLKEKGELHTQIIAAELGIKPYEVAAICSALEIKGVVVKVAGNKYAALC